MTPAVRREGVAGPLVKAVGRLGRLTYTSYESAGSGGWQVKEELGLTAAELDVLRSGVRTGLDSGAELPLFPSPEEVDRFPRRLVYAAVATGVAWWHTAPAGSDASGRPGNVFADVVVDRSPELTPATRRPIDVWRSPDWLAPYGADAVQATTITDLELPRCGGVVTGDRVVEFMLDLAHYRFPLLTALLDAVAAALTSGPRVVLGVNSTDSAALWLGAVSYLMAGQRAQGFYFSTLERGSGVASAIGQGVHVVCVPREDLDAFARDPELVLLDEDEDFEIGTPGGDPHVSQRGYEIAATEWSALAQVILVDEIQSVAALELLDQTVSRIEKVATDPAYALALVVAQMQDQFHDACAEAARVLVASSCDLPEDLQSSAGLLLASQHGGSASSAWDLIAPVAGSAERRAPSALVVELYLRLALVDCEWLIRAGGLPLPPALPRLLPAVNASLQHLVEQSLTAVGGDEWALTRTDAASAVATLANTVVRLDLDDPGLEDRLHEALERHVSGLLTEPGAAEIVGRLGPYLERTQHRFLRPLVERDRELQVGVPGTVLAPEVLTWLYPRGAEPVDPGAGDGDPTPRLRAELATLHALDPESPLSVVERPYAVWALLEDAEHAGGQVDLARFFRGHPWSAEDLSTLWRRFGTRLDLYLLEPSLKCCPSSEVLHALCSELVQTPAAPDIPPVPEGPLGVVALRFYERERWYGATGENFEAILEWMIRGGCYAISVDGPFDAVTTEHLRSACVLASLAGRHPVEAGSLRRVVGGERLLSLVEVEIVNVGLETAASLAEAALKVSMASDRAPDLGLDLAPLLWSNSLLVADGSDAEPVLLHLLKKRLLTAEVSLETLRSQMIVAARAYVKGYSDDPERTMRLVEKHVSGWLKEVGPSARRPFPWKG